MEGLATILFDSGAEITLEAPATLEILDKLNARIVSGTLVADVPETAIGFTIDTRDARVVDLGTRFGLSTDEEGKYLVQVLEGLVEVEHKGEQSVVKVTEGNSLDRGLISKKMHPVNTGSEPPRWQPDTTVAEPGGWQVIPTSFGDGKDTFVVSEAKHFTHGRSPFFRVKFTDLQITLVRVGFLAFDIGGIDPAEVNDAELVLNIEPSELGFASLVPDSVFSVYGLTDETGDNWDEDTLNWKDAPALDPTIENRTAPDPEKTRLLGTFSIERGIQRGIRSISGSELANFIRSDTNGIVTLMVFRETGETSKSGLVHAFTSKENATNPPPLLRVKTD